MADGYVKLLQMTVLPVITVSIISGLGSLTYAQARVLALRAGGVMVLLWLVALVVAFLFPLMLRPMATASFFSTTLVEGPRRFDLVELYIPANPFYSLANNIVPAVVLFSLVTGISLIGTPGKPRLIEVLAVVRDTLSRAASYVVRLTPIGLFAIAATATGTLSIDELARIQIYLIGYVALALLVSLWVLPGLIAALTPIPYRRLLGQMRDALITAFVTSDLFIVLPQLTEQSKVLAREYGLTGERENAPDVIVPASFNFPHTGKLLSLTFIFFAAWFTDVTLRLSQYPQLAVSGLLAFFGSLNVAMPFLLDLFRIPSDTFQLFLATSVVNARFGTLVATMHTVAVAILGTWAMAGALRFDARRLTRYAIVTLALTVVTVGSVRVLVGQMIGKGYEGNQILGRMRLGAGGPVPTLVPTPTLAGATTNSRPVLEEMRARGALRAGFLPDSLPFAYRNASEEMVGFDIAMAQMLARELHLKLELVPLARETFANAMSSGACDLIMSGVPLTTERAADTLFSSPYLDETIAIIVRDHLRDQFATWSGIRGAGRCATGHPGCQLLRREGGHRASQRHAEPVPVGRSDVQRHDRRRSGRAGADRRTRVGVDADAPGVLGRRADAGPDQGAARLPDREARRRVRGLHRCVDRAEEKGRHDRAPLRLLDPRTQRDSDPAALVDHPERAPLGGVSARAGQVGREPGGSGRWGGWGHRRGGLR